jgi:hypothetical protein
MPRLNKKDFQLLRAEIIKGDVDDASLSVKYGLTVQAIGQQRAKLRVTHPLPFPPELLDLADDITEKKKLLDSFIAAHKKMIMNIWKKLEGGKMPTEMEKEELRESMDRMTDIASKSVSMTQMVINAATSKKNGDMNIQVNIIPGKAPMCENCPEKGKTITVQFKRVKAKEDDGNRDGSD